MSILTALSSLFEAIGAVLIGPGLNEMDYFLMYGASEARRREEIRRQDDEWEWWGGPDDGYYEDDYEDL